MSAQNTIMAVLPSFLRIHVKRIQESPLGYRLARGAFWSAAGAVISRGLSLISSIVVARTLGRVGFGELAIINSTVAMFQLFAGFGLGVTATKYVAEYRAVDPGRAGRVIALAWIVSAGSGGLCAGLLLVFAPWLAQHTLAAPSLGFPLRLASILIFIAALNGAQEGALSGFEGFKSIAAINFLVGVLAFPLMIAGVVLAGLNGAVGAMIVSSGINWFLCYFAMRRYARRFSVPLRLSGYAAELPALWRFSLPAVLSGVMVTPIHWLCSAMLVNQDQGYMQMGVWNAANQWRNLFLFLPTVILGPVLPVLSSAGNRAGDSSGFKGTLNMVQAYIMLIAFPLGTMLMFSSDWLLCMYWKASVQESAPLIVVLTVAVVQSVGAINGPALAADGRMWLSLVFNLSWAAIYVAVTAALVGRVGVEALAYGQMTAYIIVTIGGLLWIRKILPEGMLRRVFLGLALVHAAMVLCLVVPGPWRIWLAIPMATAVGVLVAKYLVGDGVRSSLAVVSPRGEAGVV